MAIKALSVKKIDHLENLLDLKKNLVAVKKNHLVNFQKNLDNLQFGSSTFQQSQ